MNAKDSLISIRKIETFSHLDNLIERIYMHQIYLFTIVMNLYILCLYYLGRHNDCHNEDTPCQMRPKYEVE